MKDTKEEAEMGLGEWRVVMERRGLGLGLSRSKSYYLCMGQQKNKRPIKIGEEEVPESTQIK